MKIKDNELVKVFGGALSASFLQYMSNAFKTVYSIGQDFGSALRRIATRNVCPF